MFGRLFHRSKNAQALPEELVLSIKSLEVFWRPSRSDDLDSLPIVTVPSLGRWTFDGIEETAERVFRHWPDLSVGQSRRAARLIASQVASANRKHLQSGRRRHRPSFSERHGLTDDQLTY